MKKRLIKFALTAGLLLAGNGYAEGILVIGDSWAKPIVTPLQEVLTEHGHAGFSIVYSDDAVWARDLAKPFYLAPILSWLTDHPDTNIVHITIGSNDWEWGNNGSPGTYWVPSWAGTEKEVEMCSNIAKWIETAVDQILSIRPGMQVVWTGYDFFRPLDVGTPAQRNATLIMCADMAKEIAQSKPRLKYVDTNGLLQVRYGFDGVKHTQYDPAVPVPPGDSSLPDPSLPSPINSFRPDDRYHLTPEGFKVIAEEQYSQAYTLLLDGEVFQINAGLNDAWYNPDTSGQGFFITVFPDIGYVSMAWFTYDTQLPAEEATANLGDPGHRWLTAVGQITGNQAIMEIEMTSGGIFDTPTEIQRTDPPGSDGSITLTFDDCNSGTIEYNITSIQQQGIVPIRRVADDNIVICETLAY